MPDSVDAKQAVNSHARKRWLRGRTITVGLVLLVIAVTAVIVFQRRQFLISKIFPAGSPATKSKAHQAPQDKPKIYRANIPPATVKQTAENRAPRRPARQPLKKVVPGQQPKELRTDPRSSRSRADIGQQTPKSRPAISSKQPPSSTISDKPSAKQSYLRKSDAFKKIYCRKTNSIRQTCGRNPKSQKCNNLCQT